MDFDVVVIGGGPGGYVCAVRASQLGLKAAVVERSKIGGTCLNSGCIPTKAMLQVAKYLRCIDRAREFGIDCAGRELNVETVVSRSLEIVSGMNRGVSGLMSKNGVAVIQGNARLKDRNTVVIDSDGDVRHVSAKNIVIATGASPRMLPGLDRSLVEKGLVWTSKEAIFPKSIPQRLLVVGSGAIGVELASFYNAAGSDVTITEIQPRILSQEDSEVSKFAHSAFVKRGVKIRTGTQVRNFTQHDNAISVDFVDAAGVVEGGAFDAVVLGIGVVPNTSELNLAEVGVETHPNGTIKVAAYQETSVPGIYAIGDVVSPPWLAHKASREGVIAAERIAGLQKIAPINLGAIPACTYSDPQIASIGTTEESAIASGLDIKIGRSNFRGNGKALATGEPGGFVKVILGSKYGELLGAHLVGYEVTELLPIFSLAISAELTGSELAAAIFPHPTMSECLQEAIYDAFGMAIHG
jgi:dihydrolipoamide dehydrogenase